MVQNPALLRRAQPQVPPPLTRPPDSDSHWDRGEAIRATLINPSRPIVTMSLLAINIMVFLACQFPALVNGQNLTNLGELSMADVAVKKEWWRILSYAFLHANWLHLASNMYGLFIIGPILETMWGSTRYLVLYLVSAVVGGCAVILTGTLNPTVGASGRSAAYLRPWASGCCSIAIRYRLSL